MRVSPFDFARYIRLARRGFLTGIIAPPTLEEAPLGWRNWRNQRTRWLKGWMQTWLVHMRDPARLYRDLGPIGFAAVQVLFFGMIASALVHPLFAVLIGGSLWSLLAGEQLTLFEDILLGIDGFNFVSGYLGFALLAHRGADAGERLLLGRRLWSLPLYWLMIAYAALRALRQLARDPHVWEKTPHRPAPERPSQAKRPAPLAAR